MDWFGVLQLEMLERNVISICMGSTSADIDGINNAMLKKQPIMVINGCKNNCVKI
ncbi:putative zinc-binding protein [Methanobrevibacter sp.]|uniref:putative zinc-binding protein n=1 Tax=Methanobrevibacter sp. TaxID=66852 RepID=UPI00388DA35C